MPIVRLKLLLWLFAAYILLIVLSSCGCVLSLNLTSIKDSAIHMSTDVRGDEPLLRFHVPTHASGYMSSCSCDAPQKVLKDGSFEVDARNPCEYDLHTAGKVGNGVRSRKLIEQPTTNRSMKVSLKHRDFLNSNISKKDSFRQALQRDGTRMHGIHARVEVKRQANTTPVTASSSAKAHRAERFILESLESTVESGASLGAGEYFVDFFMGSPPRHFSLIIDTGSDLTWVQCSPCDYCYQQEGPLFDPTTSSSYKPISCSASECQLVYPATEENCTQEKPKNCSYSYWYGDHSNTSGTFATETVTISATNKTTLQFKNVMFGCGTANKGLFQGADGLLGLGQGPLSFSSQLKSIIGSKFSYCLVDRDNNMSVSSTLIFGEDKSLSSHPDVQYIPFAKRPEAMDTFYYVKIVHVLVGGETLPIPASTWEIDENGYGGTIFDSGTTLTYLAQPAYEVIKAAFESRISYPRATIMPEVLDVCYNVTGIKDPIFPEFSIVFENNALMHFATTNYFVKPDPDEEVICLTVLGTQPSTISIIGNFQQQNFHIMYDRENLQIKFAPMMCASL
ncbi:hypothetical protein O6H91_20G052800 [Diphasiastrum complanatum]|uniref:Uncharacterized protein n=2 Tax=Diphasiastrum complanatum TaxID=34168 RepID=A0ACC2ARS4_DIPCM|nr:hypothetical protein O6H91_20G052800 [Diphasiastrum complanatum]